MAKVVSVHSFRGGTGKSNTTANLAALVASLGYRVGVVDTDVQSPGIHVLFGFDEEKMPQALNDYLWGRCAVEETAYDVTSVLAGQRRPRSAIYLIPSSLKAGEIARVLREGYDVGLLNEGFQDLIARLQLDFLFIDTHPGLNEETLLSITISDTLLLLLRPDQQDFQGTAVTVDIARKLEVPDLQLLVNKVLPSFDLVALQADIEKTFAAPVIAIFPLTEEMVQLGSRGIFCLQFPQHPLSLLMHSVVQRLL
jgi:MinD-like ATPase involved in chromosome partitioning or flagellar assembly